MIQIFWFVVLVFVIVKFKKFIGKLWNSINSDTKINIVDRPSVYRNYNPYILLVEQIHWEVVPAMGESMTIIQSNLPDVIGLLRNSSALKQECTLRDLEFAWAEAGRGQPNEELFKIFFKAIANKNTTVRYESNELLSFIKVAV